MEEARLGVHGEHRVVTDEVGGDVGGAEAGEEGVGLSVVAEATGELN